MSVNVLDRSHRINGNVDASVNALRLETFTATKTIKSFRDFMNINSD
jgi:hypothetical protein